MTYLERAQVWQNDMESVTKILMGVAFFIVAGMAMPASAYEARPSYYYSNDSYRSEPMIADNFSYAYDNQFADISYSYYPATSGYANHPRYAEPAKKRLHGGGQIIRAGEYCPGSMGYMYNPYYGGITYTCY